MNPAEPPPAPIPPSQVPADQRPAGVEPAGPAANGLTPEEQMAAFEKELKENDWGHQPC